MRAFQQLVRAASLEFVRDRLIGLSSITMFIVYLTVYAAITIAFAGRGEAGAPNLLRECIGFLIVIGVLSISTIGVAVPIVAARERGTLKLLATKPVSTGAYLLSFLPSRLVVIAAELVIIMGIAVVCGFTTTPNWWRFAVSVTLGTAMCFAFGLLFATRSRNALATQHAAVTLTLLVVGLSGGVYPVRAMPEWVQWIANVLPPAWFASATAADLNGAIPLIPVPILWALMLAATALMAWLSHARFAWDKRIPATPIRHPEGATA